MNPLTMPLETVAEEHLQQLIDHGVSEGKSIDFKLDLRLEQDAEKKEFLADVTSFANTVGGHLIVGVDEQDGVASALHGVELGGVDPFTQKIESIVKSAVAPRMPQFQVSCVELANGRYVAVMRIGQSWVAPHMVTFKGSSRFFVRTSAGKHQMDVGEIRTAFLATDATGDRMRSFRSGRVGAVISDETVLPMPSFGKLVVHLLPIESFTSVKELELSRLTDRDLWLPRGHHGLVHTFEGMAVCRPDEDGNSYALAFRNGCLEFVVTDSLRPGPEGDRSLSGIDIENTAVDLVRENMGALTKLGIEPPVFACITVANVRGRRMSVPPQRRFDSAPLRRDTIVLPETQLDDLVADPRPQLRGTLDVFWNAFGHPGWPTTAK